MTPAPAVLLTGATGFLGSTLARRLAQDQPVVALTRATSNLARLRAAPVARHDAADPEGAFARHRIGWVVHAATCYGRAGESEAEVAEANTAFPSRVLAAARGVSLFVNIDTGLPDTTNAYSRTKAAFRDAGRRAAEAGQLRFVNLRLQHFYGAGDAPSKFTTWVIRSCLANVPELALTPGEQLRDFLHVDDAVEAILAVVRRERGGTPGFRDYDVGSGTGVSIRHFAETVRALAGAVTRLNFGARPYRDGEPMRSVADIRALRELGWAPRLTLEQGLRRTLDEERSQ